MLGLGEVSRRVYVELWFEPEDRGGSKGDCEEEGRGAALMKRRPGEDPRECRHGQDARSEYEGRRRSARDLEQPRPAECEVGVRRAEEVECRGGEDGQDGDCYEIFSDHVRAVSVIWNNTLKNKE